MSIAFLVIYSFIFSFLGLMYGISYERKKHCLGLGRYEKKFDNQSSGELAKELKAPVGEIGCPHCGTVTSGVIELCCSFCDKPYWDTKDLQPEFKEIVNKHFWELLGK